MHSVEFVVHGLLWHGQLLQESSECLSSGTGGAALEELLQGNAPAACYGPRSYTGEWETGE